MIGSRLGHYEITGKLGAGGMGEVWRAKDTHLGREVALKVLPEGFAADPERLARFEREAKMLAQLNHPSIAHIHGLEISGERRALVMELVEGPTLAERLEQGPLPVQEALAIALRIAEALESAHERGIIHRDLKPQNIKASIDGQVKVLDFGLAKAIDPVSSVAGPASQLAQSPTMTLGATVHGVILGTAAYMAPEQARGLAADKRADIWAFGVVVFEMLSGRRLFEGEMVSDILAGVLRQEIGWGALPAATPPAIRRLLRRCLERNPTNRLHDIADARIVIAECLAGKTDEPVSPASAPIAAPAPRLRPGLLAAAVAGALVLGVTAGAWFMARRAAVEREMRFPLALPAGWKIVDTDYPALAISRDGRRRVVAAADENGVRALLVAELGSSEWRRLPGTDEARAPFFSPDAAWIGYFGATELRRIAVAGGPPLAVAAGMGDVRGGVWTPDDQIVYGPEAAAPLWQVPASGGAPKPLTTLESGERTHRWPELLPDGRVVLFTDDTSATTEFYDDATIVAVMRATGERKVVLRGSSMARFLAPGTLVFARGGTLFAQPFDARKLELNGSPVPVLSGVATEVSTGSVQFALSDEGSLFWMPGEAGTRLANLSWANRQGQRTPLDLPVAQRFQIALSPDGRRLATSLGDSTGNDIWVEDLERGTRTRISFEGLAGVPTWSPDGTRVAYERPAVVDGILGPNDILWRAADGSGEAEPLVVDPDANFEGSFTPDGHYFVYERRPVGGSNSDLWVADLRGEPRYRPLVAGPFEEGFPAIAPDGRWLAYVSFETGHAEVYVRPFPTGSGRWQVSNGGGLEPRWSRDGREIFYRDRGWLYRVPIDTAEGFAPGKPERLLDGVRLGTNSRTYGVAPDGQRFIVLSPTISEHELDRVSLALHWDREVRRLVDGKP